jgi:hypothetical protein
VFGQKTRPEPIKTALGKPARAVERYSAAAALAKDLTNIVACLILRVAVENHLLPISVTYITPGEHSYKSETFCSLAQLKPSDSDFGLLNADGTIIPPNSSPGERNGPPVVTL